MPNKSLSRSGLLTYQKYSSLLAGNDPYLPPSEVILAETVLTAPAASVTFSSLGDYSEYKNLQIRYVAKSSATGTASRGVSVRVNGDSTASYTGHRLLAEGTTFYLNSYTGQTSTLNLANCTASASNASAFGAGVIDVIDAFDTGKYTTFRAFSGMTDAARIGIGSGLYLNTAAVNSLEVEVDNDFIAGSRFTLIGLK